MDNTDTDQTRFGGRPAGGARAGCRNCRHPYALHGNGTKPCRAFACTAGPSVECPACRGTTRNVATGSACVTCKGKGSVKAPCQGFVAAGEGSDVREQLVS